MKPLKKRKEGFRKKNRPLLTGNVPQTTWKKVTTWSTASLLAMTPEMGPKWFEMGPKCDRNDRIFGLKKIRETKCYRQMFFYFHFRVLK